MPTIQEVLKATGLTDEEIAKLDAKVVTGLQQWGDQTIQTAAQKEEAAALNQRKINDYISNELNPALNNWANEKTAYEAKIAAYNTAFEQAKAAGFIAPEINVGSPTLDTNGGQPPRDPQTGQFVAGKNPVPGSPGFDPARFQEGVGAYIGTMQDLQWKYQTLFGSVMPDSPTTIVREAQAQHMNPIEYAAKKYNFAGKEQEVATKKQQERDEQIRKEAIAERDRYHAERQANPLLAQAETSQFSTINKAVKAGTLPDPLKMSKEERHQATLNLISKDIRDREQVQ